MDAAEDTNAAIPAPRWDDALDDLGLDSGGGPRVFALAFVDGLAVADPVVPAARGGETTTGGSAT
jgi:hypothetical protein